MIYRFQPAREFGADLKIPPKKDKADFLARLWVSGVRVNLAAFAEWAEEDCKAVILFLVIPAKAGVHSELAIWYEGRDGFSPFWE